MKYLRCAKEKYCKHNSAKATVIDPKGKQNLKKPKRKRTKIKKSHEVFKSISEALSSLIHKHDRMRWYNFTFLQRNFRKIKTALFQSSTKTKSKTETLFRFEVSWYCYAFIFSLSGTKNIHFFSLGNQTEIGKRRKEGRKKDTRSTDSFLISSRLMALSPPIVEAQATVSFLQFLCKSERFIYT